MPMSTNEEVNVFESLSVEELQQTVEELSTQLRDVRLVLKNKRMSGVRAAIEARREADSDLTEELRKIGYTTTGSVAAKLGFTRF
jgi:hypothetical protein